MTQRNIMLKTVKQKLVEQAETLLAARGLSGCPKYEQLIAEELEKIEFLEKKYTQCHQELFTLDMELSKQYSEFQAHESQKKRVINDYGHKQKLLSQLNALNRELYNILYIKEETEAQMAPTGVVNHIYVSVCFCVQSFGSKLRPGFKTSCATISRCSWDTRPGACS